MNNPSFPIGTNLNGISNSSPQFPFIDYFKSSRDWSISGSENQVSFDADGWVTSLDGDTSVRTSFPNNNLGGQFVVLYEGEGTIGYTGAVKQDKSASVPGRDIVNIEPNKTPGLTITETDPNNNGNYIRNIQIIPAEYENLAESQTFNPDFLKSLEGYQVMRFMDWMSTNNSQISDWDDRPDIESANYFGEGVPVEILVELANQTGIDPWFTLPHLATDEYIENFAQYVEDNLNPNLDIYIEYSNEVWNSGLNQTRYAQAQGSQQFPDAENLAEATRYWYTQRTIEMAQIWDEVFGQNKDRVTGVVGTQVANDLLATQSLEYIESTGLSYEEAGIDAIGVAPYFRLELRDQSNVSAIEGWVQQGQDFALDQLFKEITVGGVMPKGYPGGSLQRPIDMVTSHLALTEPRGLDLIAYEGGQSVAPLQRGGMENNKALADLFIAANRDPRMGDVYKQYLNTWDELTGDDLFVHFSDVSTYSKFGSWGSRESIYQESSPKYDAIQQVIGNHSGPGNPPPEPDPDLDKDNNLTGTPGNDVIISGAGNDRISAGAGDDVLIGVNDQNINPGLGEQDRLKGDAGADTFVLGNSTKVFYKDNSATISGGWKGRAVIVDFSSGEDRIQLSASGNYQLEVAQNSTRIFEISGLVKDVIGVVNNTTDLNLQNLDQFVFV